MCLIFESKERTRGSFACDAKCIHWSDKHDPGHPHIYQPSELTILPAVTLQKLRDPKTVEIGEVCSTILVIGATQRCCRS